MPFAVGFWDSIFGKRVTLKIPTTTGDTVRRSVTRRWLDQLQSGGDILTDRQLVKVHMLDAAQGYSILFWMVGDDIADHMAGRFMDAETGALYAIHYFEHEDSRTELVDKQIWEKAFKKFLAI